VIFTQLRRVAQCSACVNTCDHVFGCGRECAYDEPGLRRFFLSHLSPLTRRRAPRSTPFFLQWVTPSAAGARRSCSKERPTLDGPRLSLTVEEPSSGIPAHARRHPPGDSRLSAAHRRGGGLYRWRFWSFRLSCGPCGVRIPYRNRTPAPTKQAIKPMVLKTTSTK